MADSLIQETEKLLSKYGSFVSAKVDVRTQELFKSAGGKFLFAWTSCNEKCTAEVQLSQAANGVVWLGIQIPLTNPMDEKVLQQNAVSFMRLSISFVPLCLVLTPLGKLELHASFFFPSQDTFHLRTAFELTLGAGFVQPARAELGKIEGVDTTVYNNRILQFRAGQPVKLSPSELEAAAGGGVPTVLCSGAVAYAGGVVGEGFIPPGGAAGGALAGELCAYAVEESPSPFWSCPHPIGPSFPYGR